MPTETEVKFAFNHAGAPLMWHPESKVFSGESSEVEHYGMMFRTIAPGQLGMTVRGKTPNLDAVYVLKAQHRDADGDTTFWEFVPTAETLARIPKAEGTSVQIFND